MGASRLYVNIKSDLRDLSVGRFWCLSRLLEPIPHGYLWMIVLYGISRILFFNTVYNWGY
jgi:hypothetical protein